MQWLSELRHMGRFVAERQSAPRSALEQLADLHETALEEILPALALSTESEALRVQTDRLQRSSNGLRRALIDHPSAESRDLDVRIAQPDSLRR